MRSLLLAAVNVVAFATVALAQNPVPAYRNRLLGVFDERSGDPVEGAEVEDVLGKTTALTTKTGTVTLAFLPEGGGMIRIRKIGYNSQTMVVVISPADTVPITVLLSAAGTVLPKVVTTDSAPRYVSPALNAFEERRRHNAGGNFITGPELRKEEGRTSMANLMRRIPGMQVMCGRPGTARGAECWPVARRSQSKYAILGGECSVEMHIDGVPVTDNDLNKLRIEEFGAVEYYAGAAVPAEYNRTGSVCGVLLLWSRER